MSKRNSLPKRLSDEILDLKLHQVKELLDHLIVASMADAVGNNGRAIFSRISKRKLGRQKRIYERLSDCSKSELYSIGRNLVATGKFPGVKKYEFGTTDNGFRKIDTGNGGSS